jgi:hypothetical protein
MNKSNTSSDSSNANSIKSNPNSQTDNDNRIYCYSTRNKFNASNTFNKQLRDLLNQTCTIKGRQNKIRHMNNVFDLLRRNKKNLLCPTYPCQNLLIEIRNKTLEMYHKEKLYRLANEWHFWIFDTYIAG